jgi:hypothetical protein
MKLLKSILLLSFFAFAVVPAFANNNILKGTDPLTTITIKNSQATNTDKFFGTVTMLSFEVVKPSSQKDLAAAVKTLQLDPAIESVVLGEVNGDFHSVTIVLKNSKNKAWFVSEFKKLGATQIKINNTPAVDLDKL